ncbi:MAG: prepilin-type N-terminal cleavage/methylation domain-containing protein [Glaciecola sp.]
MKQQKGFTLIELIIVIVILGILAVTAAPRFIDIQKDARTETMQGVKAAIQGASQLVYAKAAIKGVQKAADSTVTIGTDTIDIKYGYPDAANLTTMAAFQEFVDIDDEKLEIEAVSTADTVRVKYVGIDSDDSGSTPLGCYIIYRGATGEGVVPSITVNSSSC